MDWNEIPDIDQEGWMEQEFEEMVPLREWNLDCSMERVGGEW